MSSYISKNIITEIIAASDILEVISESVVLKQTGQNFVGLCPFHTEKTPSFTVSPDKQIYYCFGCGQGGNIFSFLMKYEGLSFPEAVKIIANRFGIKIPRKNEQGKIRRNFTERETIIAINNDAMLFFHQNLSKSNFGNNAMSYLKHRGIDNKVVDKFKLGYAPPKWQNLKKYLEKKHWGKKEIITSGLIIKKEGTNNLYDRFRNRIIFPIFDVRNSVIGFGARVIDKSLPKYLNSPESAAYNKSESLYGINNVKQECKKNGIIFIVEGYFDLLVLHQFGIKNSVATLGTSITKNHILQLKGIIGKSGKLIIAYDSDQAGINAVCRNLSVFQKEIFDVKILVLPAGYDPDSYVMEFGPKEFIKRSKEALSMLSFMIDSEINTNGLDFSGKIKIINKIKKFIATNENSLSRKLDIQQFADQINVDEFIIQQEIDNQIKKNSSLRESKHRNKKNKNSYISSEKKDYTKTYRLERQILSLILQFPETIKIVESKRIINKFKNKKFKTIANLAINKYSSNRHYLNNILEECNDKNQKSMILKMALTGEKWNEMGFVLLIKQFEKIIAKESNLLMKKITQAEQKNNIELVEKLLKEKLEVMK